MAWSPGGGDIEARQRTDYGDHSRFGNSATAGFDRETFSRAGLVAGHSGLTITAHEMRPKMKNQHATRELLQAPPARQPIPDGGQLGVIQEMLGALESSTTAGQLYVMAKVIAGLEREISRWSALLAESQRRIIARWLEDLARLASWCAPDVGAFIARANLVLGTLADAI
jgi:hypothetical protein